MSDYGTENREVPQLLAEVMSLLAGARGAFNQERTHRRGVALVLGALVTFARHTVTQELRMLGLIDVDWSACYRLFSRRRYDPRKLERQILQETAVSQKAVASIAKRRKEWEVGVEPLEPCAGSWMKRDRGTNRC